MSNCIIKMGKVKSLRICHVNVRSILSTGRLLELEVLCYVNDVDVLCVTETWLSPQRIKEGASLLNIPGYLPPFRCDRMHKRGGGVAVFVRRGLHVSPMPLSPGLEAPCAGPRNRPKSGCCGPAEATYKLFSRQWRKKKVTSGSFPLSCGLSWHNATIFLIKLSS